MASPHPLLSASIYVNLIYCWWLMQPVSKCDESSDCNFSSSKLEDHQFWNIFCLFSFDEKAMLLAVDLRNLHFCLPHQLNKQKQVRVTLTRLLGLACVQLSWPPAACFWIEALGLIMLTLGESFWDIFMWFSVAYKAKGRVKIRKKNTYNDNYHFLLWIPPHPPKKW